MPKNVFAFLLDVLTVKTKNANKSEVNSIKTVVIPKIEKSI